MFGPDLLPQKAMSNLLSAIVAIALTFAVLRFSMRLTPVRTFVAALGLWMEKKYVQYTALFGLVSIIALVWGSGFESPYKFDWTILFTINETYQIHFGHELLKALIMTVKLSIISAIIALFLGIVFGLCRLSKFKPLYYLSTWYVEFFRNTPLLVQLFFWYYAFPLALPETAREWVFGLDFEYWTACVGLSLYTGAFMAEVIRAGLQSIPKGLLEASYSSGLNYFQVLTRIILPLAFRAIIPPLGSEFLNNMKNSSLAMVVGVHELAFAAQDVEALTFHGFEAATAASILYLCTSLGISSVMNIINRKLQVQTGKRSVVDRCVDGVCKPFSVAWRVGYRPIRRAIRHHKLKKQQASYTASQAARIQIMKKLRALLVLALKGVFLAAIAYVIYLVVLGLSTFKWQIIWDNLRFMFVYRFPNGEAEDFFRGLGGLSFSLIMAIVSITASFPIGLLVGLGRMSKNSLFSIPCTAYIEIIRGNPLIMVIFWVYFFIGVLTGKFLDPFMSATIALTVFNAAYIGEIVRGGIQNIPPGQFEAAKSTGLTYWQTMARVILPQALKQMIPAIVGQFIAIFKDTSLAYIIGVTELTNVAMILNNRLLKYPFEIWTTVAVMYFVGCYLMSIYAKRLEARLSPEKVRLEM